MAGPKTKPTRVSVSAFLKTVDNPARVADAKVVSKLMREATGTKPAMWGPSIVGFGSYHYVYASGREGDWPIVGFSPRKTSLVLYLSQTSAKRAPLLKRLGKHKAGKACVYVSKLSDVDLDVLAELIRDSVAHTRKHHDCGACAEPKTTKAKAKKTKAKAKAKAKAKKTTKAKAKKTTKAKAKTTTKAKAKTTTKAKAKKTTKAKAKKKPR